MPKKLLTAKLYPSTFLKRMMKHKGDLSEGSKAKVMAQRSILGKKVTFYTNGLRVVDDPDLSEDDEHFSEILSLVQASLILNDSVGDKESCYVDATVNPVIVFIYGQLWSNYIKTTKKLIRLGQLDEDFVLNSPIQQTKELKDVRNVRLFGR